MTRARRFLWTALPLPLLLIGSIPAFANPITLTLTDYIDFGGLPAGTALTFQATLPGPQTAYPNSPFTDYFDFTAANLISPLPANVQFSGDILLKATNDIDHINEIQWRDELTILGTNYEEADIPVFFRSPCLQTPSTCTGRSLPFYVTVPGGGSGRPSTPDTLTVTSSPVSSPESSTWGLCCAGLALLMVLRRRLSGQLQ